MPPSLHAGWRPAVDRPDPVALLEEQARTRLPELVPLRHARMAVSPFAFYRGAALVMAADLAPLPMSGLRAQVCGDAHLVNFGLFASPERDLLFDINDFDETAPGAWEWDVMRLAASLVLAARAKDFGSHHADRAAEAAVRSYVERMREYAEMRAIDVYYVRVDASAIMDFADHRARAYLRSTIESAARHDALHELPKITTAAGGARRIVDRPPVVSHPADLDLPAVAEALARYRDTLQEDRRVLLDRYSLVDAALKVVGVGSVGLGAYIALLEGADDRDPIFLQVKEAEASVYERFVGPAGFEHHGQRVVAGQRRLQAASDVLLGWTTGKHGRHLYVRQLQDQKAGAVLEAMTHADLTAWGALCGWTLARGHARSGDPVAIAAYIGKEDEMVKAIASFATRYADQAELDHAALLTAIREGRLEARDDTGQRIGSNGLDPSVARPRDAAVPAPPSPPSGAGPAADRS